MRSAALSLAAAVAGVVAIYAARLDPLIAIWGLIAALLALAWLAAGAQPARLEKALWLTALGLVATAALDAEVKVLFAPRITVDGRYGGFIISDPLLGYGPRPGVVARVRWRRLAHVIYDCRYTIDAEGRRATRGTAPPGAATVVFMGDSFTFGDGLNDPDTLPQRFADAVGPGRRVINAAVTGYGANQVLRLIQSDRLMGRLGSGTPLFIYPALDEHLARADPTSPLHRIGTPRYELVGDGVKFAGPFRPGLGGLIMDLAQRSAIIAGVRDVNRPPPDPKEARLFGAMMEEAQRAAARRYGARFIVLLWDESFRPAAPPREAALRVQALSAMASEITRRGVPFIRVSDLIPDFQAHLGAYLIAGSGHPTAALDKRLAAALAARLYGTSGDPRPPGQAAGVALTLPALYPVGVGPHEMGAGSGWHELR